MQGDADRVAALRRDVRQKGSRGSAYSAILSKALSSLHMSDYVGNGGVKNTDGDDGNFDDDGKPVRTVLFCGMASL